MSQPPIPAEYFRTYDETEVLVPAADFCHFTGFKLQLNSDHPVEGPVLTRVVERLMMYALTHAHLVELYCDEVRYVVEDIINITQPVKGSLPDYLTDGTLDKLMTESLKVLDHYVINPWGLYTTRCEFPFVLVGYVGDYRIIRWSMSDEANRDFKHKSIEGRIYEELHNIRRSR